MHTLRALVLPPFLMDASENAMYVHIAFNAMMTCLGRFGHYLLTSLLDNNTQTGRSGQMPNNSIDPDWQFRRPVIGRV